MVGPLRTFRAFARHYQPYESPQRPKEHTTAIIAIAASSRWLVPALSLLELAGRMPSFRVREEKIRSNSGDCERSLAVPGSGVPSPSRRRQPNGTARKALGAREGHAVKGRRSDPPLPGTPEPGGDKHQGRLWQKDRVVLNPHAYTSGLLPTTAIAVFPVGVQGSVDITVAY